MVDMRGIGKIGRLVSDMTRHRVRLMSAGETLIKRCRLDDSLVRKLLVRGWDDRETRRRPFFGRLRSLQTSAERIEFRRPQCLPVRRLGRFL